MNPKTTLDAIRDLVAPDVRKEVLTAVDAGKLLGVCPRTIWSLAKQGVLQRVYLPGRQRAFGYTRSSVEKLAGIPSTSSGK